MDNENKIEKSNSQVTDADVPENADSQNGFSTEKDVNATGKEPAATGFQNPSAGVSQEHYENVNGTDDTYVQKSKTKRKLNIFGREKHIGSDTNQGIRRGNAPPAAVGIKDGIGSGSSIPHTKELHGISNGQKFVREPMQTDNQSSDRTMQSATPQNNGIGTGNSKPGIGNNSVGTMGQGGIGSGNQLGMKSGNSKSIPHNMVGGSGTTGLGIGGNSNGDIKNSLSMTDNRNLSRILDGDEFNTRGPEAVANSFISIPGTGVHETMRSLDMDLRMFSTHIAMVGGIGSGKSNMFNHLISQTRSKMGEDDIAIIFDTKGDFYKDFGSPGDVVFSNDARSTGSEGEDYWNIFNEIDPTDVDSSIREISSSLFKESIENSSNAFFPNAAADLFYAFMSIFYTTWKSQNGTDPTNYDLVMFFKNASPNIMLQILKEHKRFNSIASHISDPRSGQSQGVIAEMNAVVNRVFIGNFVKRGTLSMTNLVKERGGKVVFIEYDVKTGEVLTPIYSMLVDMALKQALSNRSDRKGSVYLFVDEFKLLPNLSHIDDAVNFGRSLGMKVVIALQSITQMYDNYGETRAKSILSGFLNYFFFNVNNAESREFIKGRFGKCLRMVVYGQAKEYVYMDDVVKDKDITRLGVGEMIVGFQNCPPFVFRSTEWKP